MTVIRPNSISGINSITGNGGDISIFRADGTAADVTVNNITSGVVTATTFKGAVEGNLSGGTINVTSGTVTGNLGVGGVLTYEDVTNVDSVGVITARSGINLTGGVINSAGNINCTSGRLQRGSATVQDGDAIAGGLNINGTDMDASLIMSVFGNDGDFTRISGSKSRNASVGSHTIVQDNDVLLSLKGFGSDGTNFEEASQIEMQVDGTPGNNVMPGRIVFKTATTDGVTERLRISSSGIVTKPYLPAWSMHGTGVQSLSSATKLAFSVNGTGFGSFTNRNHGGVNTSDNSYTVPVTGLYSVSVVIFFYNNSNTNTISIVPRINGNQLNNGTDIIFFCGMKPYQNNGTISGTLLLQLSANDKITIHRRDGESGPDNVYLAHSVFMGHLVG